MTDRVNDSASVYRRCVLDEVWRLSSLIDRNPFSPTRGSAARIHWAWKFNDFPFPRMQEAVYSLCRLHDLPGHDNPLYHSAPVADWIGWGFAYWARLQQRNGSFDEAYPNEQCLAATAFTGFYLGSAYLLWKDRLPRELAQQLEATFHKAGTWLCNNGEGHALISNHLGVAVAALEIIARITGQERFQQRARHFLQRILDHQSPEGWLLEYDGADIGYGTHGFFYLAAYQKATGCRQTQAALSHFAEFLTYFVHPDGTIGGEYGSRNTEFYFPAGFELLADSCSHSRAIARRLRPSIALRRVCGLWGVDAFNYFPLLNNYLFALAAPSESSARVQPLPWQSAPFERYFPHAGLWVVNRPRTYTIIALSKGGTVSVFDKEKQQLTGRHSGLVCRIGKRLFCSQDYTPLPTVQWSADGKTATIEVPWKGLRFLVFTPWLFLLFRFFTLTLGRFPTVSRWVKKLLVAVLIRRKRRPNIRHQRSLRVQADGVAIVDRVTFPPEAFSVAAVEQFTAIHMGSSMYCDARAVVNGTARVDFPARPQVELHGKVGLHGSQWAEQKESVCAASAA